MATQTAPSPVPGLESFFGHKTIQRYREIGILHLALETWQNYGDLSQMTLGPKKMILVVHPDDVRQVTITNKDHYDKGKSYDVVRQYLLGNGLVTSVGEDWLWQRRVMAEFFTPRGVARFGDMMIAEAGAMVERWRSLPADKPVDISEQMIEMTAIIILKAIFSTEDYNGIRALKGDVETMLNFSGTISRAVVNMPLWWPSTLNRSYLAARQRVTDFVVNLVASRRRLEDSAWPEDLLTKVIRVRDEETNRQMSQQEVIDQSITFFVAGHETTARLMGFALYALAKEPEIEAKLIAEVDREIKGDLPTMDELQRMSYTLRVIKETLRLYPSTAFYPRDVVKDDVMRGCKLSAGDMLLIFPYATHRHPDFWDRPEAFDPDRFAPEREAARHPQAYAPFASGQRVCIGNNFSLLEAQVLLATIYKHFRPRLVPGHDPQIKAPSMLIPTAGLPMILERR